MVVGEDDPRDMKDRGMPIDTDDMESEGSLLAHDIGGYKRNTALTPKILRHLKSQGHDRILIRSPIIGGSPDGGIYARDAGVREFGRLPGRGEQVGATASQALSEPITQGQLAAKHSGGVAGQEKSVSGFNAVDQQIQVPSSFKGGAAHATVDGQVSQIEDAPAGGKFVWIDGEQHYVGQGYKLHVQKGDHVEAGDRLSEGAVNPATVTEYKGIGEGRRAFVHSLHETMKDAGMKANRRNIEVLARGLINHVRLTDEFAGNLPGDVIPYSTLEHLYEPREDSETVQPTRSLGKYLEKPVLHYTIGTKVRPSVLKDLQHFGIKDVTVHHQPPPFEPEMIRGMASLQHDPDPFTRMYGSGLKKSLTESVHRGRISDESGTSFVPGLARGVDFGRTGQVRQPQPGTMPEPEAPEMPKRKASAVIDLPKETKSKPSILGSIGSIFKTSIDKAAQLREARERLEKIAKQMQPIQNGKPLKAVQQSKAVAPTPRSMKPTRHIKVATTTTEQQPGASTGHLAGTSNRPGASPAPRMSPLHPPTAPWHPQNAQTQPHSPIAIPPWERQGVQPQGTYPGGQQATPGQVHPSRQGFNTQDFNTPHMDPSRSADQIQHAVTGGHGDVTGMNFAEAAARLGIALQPQAIAALTSGMPYVLQQRPQQQEQGGNGQPWHDDGQSDGQGQGYGPGYGPGYGGLGEHWHTPPRPPDPRINQIAPQIDGRTINSDGSVTDGHGSGFLNMVEGMMQPQASQAPNLISPNSPLYAPYQAANVATNLGGAASFLGAPVAMGIDRMLQAARPAATTAAQAAAAARPGATAATIAAAAAPASRYLGMFGNALSVLQGTLDAGATGHAYYQGGVSGGLDAGLANSERLRNNLLNPYQISERSMLSPVVNPALASGNVIAQLVMNYANPVSNVNSMAAAGREVLRANDAIDSANASHAPTVAAETRVAQTRLDADRQAGRTNAADVPGLAAEPSTSTTMTTAQRQDNTQANALAPAALEAAQSSYIPSVRLLPSVAAVPIAGATSIVDPTAYGAVQANNQQIQEHQVRTQDWRRWAEGAIPQMEQALTRLCHSSPEILQIHSTLATPQQRQARLQEISRMAALTPADLQRINAASPAQRPALIQQLGIGRLSPQLQLHHQILMLQRRLENTREEYQQTAPPPPGMWESGLQGLSNLFGGG
jgi:hypothetical protein